MRLTAAFTAALLCASCAQASTVTSNRAAAQVDVRPIASPTPPLPYVVAGDVVGWGSVWDACAAQLSVSGLGEDGTWHWYHGGTPVRVAGHWTCGGGEHWPLTILEAADGSRFVLREGGLRKR